MPRFNDWFSIRDPVKRAAAKAADEKRLAEIEVAPKPKWPIWAKYTGAAEVRIEADAVVAIGARGYARRYRYACPDSLKFARLFADAGLPRETSELPVWRN